MKTNQICSLSSCRLARSSHANDVPCPGGHWYTRPHKSRNASMSFSDDEVLKMAEMLEAVESRKHVPGIASGGVVAKLSRKFRGMVATAKRLREERNG